MSSTLGRRIRKIEERLDRVNRKISTKRVRRDLLARQARSYRPGTREYGSVAREHDQLTQAIVDLNDEHDDLQEELDHLNREQPRHYDRFEGHRDRDEYSYDDGSDGQEWTGYRGD